MNRKAQADEGMGEFFIGITLIVAAILLVLFVGVTETEATKDLGEKLVTEAMLRRQLNQFLISPVQDQNEEIENVYDVIIRLPYVSSVEQDRYRLLIEERLNLYLASSSIGCAEMDIRNNVNYDEHFTSIVTNTKTCGRKAVGISDVVLMDINNKPLLVEFGNRLT